MALEFTGTATPLTEAGMTQATQRLQVGLPEIWAVLKVETSGCGFFADRRPRILFERHIFHRETQGRFDVTAPDISNPKGGGYIGGAPEYERLARAIALDSGAALRSASWGIGQVMGFNAETVGFAAVETMVMAMTVSEDNQLQAMFQFVVGNHLHTAMQQRDWVTFARGYNGPNFAQNEYDKKLDAAFSRLASQGVPDLRVRTAQMLLMYRGFDPGPIDGEMGKRTRNALRQFQEQIGNPVTGDPDEVTLAALQAP
jgi:N-acetylmuramidase-like protein/putative peptidoglycan binding protein